MLELHDRRQERLTVRRPLGPHNAMQYWYKMRSPLRIIFNFLLIFVCRYMPSLALKAVLLRWTGMRVGRHVSPGLMSMFDVFFPDLITLGDNVVLGYNSVILGHEFLVNEWRTGPVVVGNNVMIGANVTVLPGVVIGDGATVSAMSLVNKDVPAGAVVGGVPIRLLSSNALES